MASQMVPESHSKKLAHYAELEQKITKDNESAKKRNSQSRTLLFERTKNYELEYRNLRQSLINNRRKAKAEGSIFVEPEARLVFVVRVRGIIGVSPKVKKVLKLLRLRQIYNGVFVRLNGASISMLRLVEPFVAYGFPSLTLIRHLIYKRGYAKINGDRIPISDNCVIDHALGTKGIHGVEDLVHEIFTVGPNFKRANNFLWTFKLNPPRGGFKNTKLKHFAEGGDAGNREIYINKLVERMI